MIQALSQRVVAICIIFRYIFFNSFALVAVAVVACDFVANVSHYCVIFI